MRMFILCALFVSGTVFSFQEDEMTKEQRQVIERVEELSEQCQYELVRDFFISIPAFFDVTFCREAVIPLIVDGMLELENEVKAFAKEHPELVDSGVIKPAPYRYSKEKLEEIGADIYYVCAKCLLSEDPDFVTIREAFLKVTYNRTLLDSFEDEFSEEFLEEMNDLYREEQKNVFYESLKNNPNFVVQRLYKDLESFLENFSDFDLDEINELYPNNPIRVKYGSLYAEFFQKIPSLAHQKRLELDKLLEESFSK